MLSEEHSLHDSGSRDRLPWLIGLVGFSLILVVRLVRFWTLSGRELAAQTPDDAYYYFGVARFLAMGAGSTFDGINLTNGYHPLWMFLCTALASFSGAVGGSVEALERLSRLALSLELLLGGAGIIALGELACRVFRSGLAGGLVLAGATLPWVFYSLTDGLESGLSLLALAALFWAVWIFRPFSTPPAASDVAFGALLAVTFLARLDLALLCLALAIAVIGFWVKGDVTFGGEKRDFKPLAAKSAAWAMPVLITVAVYIFVNHLHFGTAMPISGKLKNTFPHAGLHLEWLLDYKIYFAAGLLAIIATILIWHRLSGNRDLRIWLAVGACFILLHSLNTVLFMDWAVHRWHFTGFWPFVLLAGAGAASMLLGKCAGGFARPGGVILVIGILALGGFGQWLNQRGRVERAFQTRSYDAALFTRENIPSGLPIGMTDCGVFGYFRGGGVINLDGVINNLEYQETLLEDGLAEYLGANGVAFIAHHAIAADEIQPVYRVYRYGVTAHLTEEPGGEVPLFEKNEIYRSEAFDDGRGLRHFVIWQYEGKTFRRRLSSGAGTKKVDGAMFSFRAIR